MVKKEQVSCQLNDSSSSSPSSSFTSSSSSASSSPTASYSLSNNITTLAQITNIANNFTSNLNKGYQYKLKNQNSIPNLAAFNNGNSSNNIQVNLQHVKTANSNFNQIINANSSKLNSGGNQMQNLANQLAAAAAVSGVNPILCGSNQNEATQVCFQNTSDFTNPYKLPAAAVHLISQAAAQQHHTQQQNCQNTPDSKEINIGNNSSSSSRDNRVENLHLIKDRNESLRLNGNNSNSSISSSGSAAGDVPIIGEETVRKREMRLLKNR